jgi:hypothetical protein
MAPNDSTDPNPQVATPGQVTPERTPGTAPSVVPLPSGADPSAAPGEHPLPEDAIEGYPNVAELYDGTGGNGEGAEPEPDPAPAAPAEPASAPVETKAKPTSPATSGSAKTTK